MFGAYRVAVIVPAYNEQALIAKTLASIPAWVDHVFVVDDASEDNTRQIVGSLANSRVTLVLHARNRGVGASIVTGYQAAVKAGADLLAVMAGDGQMDPDDLPALLDKVATGETLYAKGNRFAHPDVRRDMPMVRLWGGYALSRLTGWAIGMPALRDSQCGYTVMSSKVLERVDLSRLWPRYGYPNDLLGLLREEGVSVADVPVRPVYGDERSGLRPRHVGIMLALIARAAWRVRARREES